MFQQLVVGADADTYRRIDSQGERGLTPPLLSPDGTRVLLANEHAVTSELLLVDLTTGRQRRIGIGSPVGTRLLAWSPDGRYVAYSAAPPGASGGADDQLASEVHRNGTLRLLDLATGESLEVPSIKGPNAAAFAPDGARVAVQVTHDVHLLDLHGIEDRVVFIDADRALVAGAGWSPDGRFLATAPWSGGSDDGVFITGNAEITFVPVAEGTAAPPPVPDVARALGWRDATHLIAATAGSDGRLSLVEVDLTTAARRVLTRFDTGSNCELGMQHCEVVDLQLATALLPDLTVRHAGSPDRGPWPWIVLYPAAAVLLAGAAVLWHLRRRRKR
jgi:dipeptidyl aminopeptidase/acylaminoacyl peptidase